MPVSYSVRQVGELALVEFAIEGGVLDVKELREAVERAPAVSGTSVVCISGRGPVWLFTALAHKYHYTRAVATYEPRLGACVVVASHDPRFRVGDAIPVEAHPG